jgi:hypothetical protein
MMGTTDPPTQNILSLPTNVKHYSHTSQTQQKTALGIVNGCSGPVTKILHIDLAFASMGEVSYAVCMFATAH